ncbi:hypothetical protein ACVWXP_007017 [Bradyrhizobium sp. USDA 4463]
MKKGAWANIPPKSNHWPHGGTQRRSVPAFVRPGGLGHCPEVSGPCINGFTARLTDAAFLC